MPVIDIDAVAGELGAGNLKQICAAIAARVPALSPVGADGAHQGNPGLIIIGIDGKSGSGKSSVARALASELPTCLSSAAWPVALTVIAIDDHVPGWENLARGIATVSHALGRLRRADSEVAQVEIPTWDWIAQAPGNPRVITRDQRACQIIICEGCGAGALGNGGALTDVLIWCQAPHELRRARTARRDGYWTAELWRDWARQEDQVRAHWPADQHVDIRIKTG